jgi:hypothetical protein
MSDVVAAADGQKGGVNRAASVLDQREPAAEAVVRPRPVAGELRPLLILEGHLTSLINRFLRGVRGAKIGGPFR